MRSARSALVAAVTALMVVMSPIVSSAALVPAAELPSLTVADVTKVEGSQGTTVKLRFRVSLSTFSAVPVTVDFATADGTATRPVDYRGGRGTATIPVGSRSVLVPITVVGDAVVEMDEVFTLELSNPDGATIADPQGVGTITNDDTPTPPP